MDYIALGATNCFLHRGKKNRRVFLSAVVSSAGSLFFTLRIRDEAFRMIILHFIWNTLVIFVCFGRERWRQFLENWTVTYLMILLLGGMMEFGQTVAWLKDTFFLPAILSAVGLSAVTAYLGRRKQFGAHLFPVVLIHRGKRKKLTGYWDSGNQLKDPFTGRPVCILDGKIAKQLFETDQEILRLIPYTSLGTTGGLLAVLFADAMEIEQGRKQITIKPAEVGIANEGLLEGKEYDVILHASFFEET